MGQSRIIKVFIASPGDLAVERRAFKDVLDELNRGFGRGANVEFVPLGWEDALSTVGRRAQSVINADIDACDVFVLVMWRRWGQEAPDANPYSSYTEEEFYRALKRFEKNESPTIFVFFKHIDPGQMADAGPQLEKVLAFRRKLEQSRKVLYRQFKGETEFKQEIDRHLVAFAKCEIQPITEDRSVPLLPDSALAEIEKLKEEAASALRRAEQAEREATDAKSRAGAAEALSAARAEKAQLALAERAARAALNGKLEEAQQDFANALDGTTNLRVLYLGFKFFFRIGELEEAERLIGRWLALSGPDMETAETASAYGNLGIIYKTRGDLDQAEEMYKRALAIDEELDNKQGVASSFGNLGNIYKRRGDLDQAQAMHKKALAIDESLCHLEGMAEDYGNLGIVHHMRGDLDQAEEFFNKTLAIDEKLGRFEGKALTYSNLGLIHQGRGDLDQAEAMCKKSLEISEKLGILELTANQYGNLGTICNARCDTKKARELWTKARDLFKQVGMKPEVAKVQKLLDSLDEPKP